jgi:hypothetical protein
VERTLHQLYIGADAGLRDEDKKKAREVTALLEEVQRIGRRRLVVEAASGHAYAGILAAALCGGIEELTVIERDGKRVERAQRAAGRLGIPIDARQGDVDARALWPDRPDLVIALHACGAASDAIIDVAIEKAARWLLLVPCCYARSLAFAPGAEAHADAIGMPRQAPLRRAFVQSLVDAERTLRLEARGYEVTVVELVPRSVSGHNLLWRCRRSDEPVRMAAATAQLERLTSRSPCR